MTTEFFDTLYPSEIEGEIEDVVVTDPDNTPNHVLQLGQPWDVEVTWKLTTNKPTTYPLSMIDGTWHLQLSVESIGPGMEAVIATATLPVNPPLTSTPAERTWEHKFALGAGVITEERIFELGTLITFKDTNGVPMAMAGFHKGPAISFYQP